MANLQYSSDIMNYILFKAGEKTDGTSDFDAQALIYLNTAYRKIWQGGSEFDPTINEDWVWLRGEGNLLLPAQVTAGTVAVTKDSTGVNMSVTPDDTSVVGWFFKVNDHNTIFKVATVPGGGGSFQFLLDSVYTGDTNATASYKLVQLDYTLATAAIEILTPMYTTQDGTNAYNKGMIDGVSFSNILSPYELIAGVPQQFAQIDDTTVRFDRHAGADVIRIDYRYKQRPSDLTDSGSEEPLVPLRHRHVLASIALFDIFSDKNDDRADAMSLIAKQGLKAMSVENRNRLSQMDGSFGKIYPHREHIDNRYIWNREPYS